MKRHPSLEPFSRDHNTVLVLARELTIGREGAREHLLNAWEAEMQDHFSEEERLLDPLLTPEQRERLVVEHRRIESQIEAVRHKEAAVSPREVGTLLHDHVRWEERELFPGIERNATSDQLATLAEETAKMEERHSASGLAPRRAELVERRKKAPVTENLLALIDGSGSTGPLWGTATEDLNCTFLRWKKGQGVTAHVNDEVDVAMVVLSGEGELLVEGVMQALEPGRVAILPKGAVREIRVTGNDLSYLNVHRKRVLMPKSRPPARDGLT